MRVFGKLLIWFSYLLILIGSFLILISPNQILSIPAKVFFFLGLIIIFLFSKKIKAAVLETRNNEIPFFSINSFYLFYHFFFNIFGALLLSYHLNYFVKNGLGNFFEMSPGLFLSLGTLYFSYNFRPIINFSDGSTEVESKDTPTSNQEFKVTLVISILLCILTVALPIALTGINRALDFSKEKFIIAQFPKKNIPPTHLIHTI